MPELTWIYIGVGWTDWSSVNDDKLKIKTDFRRLEKARESERL